MLAGMSGDQLRGVNDPDKEFPVSRMDCSFVSAFNSSGSVPRSPLDSVTEKRMSQKIPEDRHSTKTKTTILRTQVDLDHVAIIVATNTRIPSKPFALVGIGQKEILLRPQ